jgi:ABC-type nitrate/sulfonate/bicarbonate transport system substrate-binding protein
LMLKIVLVLLVVLAANLVDPYEPAAQERVRIGWAAMTASHTPLWVAQEKGLLAKQGITPELVFFGVGPTAMQALVAGDLDIVITSAPNVVNPRLGGVDAVMIMSIIPTFIDHIISAPSITSPEQLKGKTGSVNRFGSISEMGSVFLCDGSASIPKRIPGLSPREATPSGWRQFPKESRNSQS